MNTTWIYGWVALDRYGRFTETWTDRSGVMAVPGTTYSSQHLYRKQMANYAYRDALDSLRYSCPVMARVMLYGPRLENLKTYTVARCHVLWVADMSLVFDDMIQNEISLVVDDIQDGLLKQMCLQMVNDWHYFGIGSPNNQRFIASVRLPNETLRFTEDDERFTQLKRMLCEGSLYALMRLANYSWVDRVALNQRLETMMERHAPRRRAWETRKLQVAAKLGLYA